MKKHQQLLAQLACIISPDVQPATSLEDWNTADLLALLQQQVCFDSSRAYTQTTDEVLTGIKSRIYDVVHYIADTEREYTGEMPSKRAEIAYMITSALHGIPGDLATLNDDRREPLTRHSITVIGDRLERVLSMCESI